MELVNSRKCTQGLQTEVEFAGVTYFAAHCWCLQVPWRIYSALVHGLGRHCSVAMITLYILYHAASVGANVWLSQWTDNKQLNNLTVLPADSQERYAENAAYLGVYGALGLAQCE